MPAIELSAEVRQDGRARGDPQRNRAGFAVTVYRPLVWCSGGVSRPTCQLLHHDLRQRYRRKVIEAGQAAVFESSKGADTFYSREP